MSLSNNSIERICKIFGYLDTLDKQGTKFASSLDLAKAIGATSYTVRKDISLLNIIGYTRKGYDVKTLKEELGQKLCLNKKRNACIVGLGRLGSALLDYEKFQEDGFDVVAGFDSNINKLERIRTDIDVYPVSRINEIIIRKHIELGIIAVPSEYAQNIADTLIKAGVTGILNFSYVKINLPKNIINVNLDFTNSLRFIAAKLSGNTTNK
ncbi:MAG: redox-sensing transcriptional repressor Rex [Candidatus Omnitrophica bacterium]|nr:redox-sensing transcriptional repressor Rex [Candidatus Omnitrophota bacterium]